MGDFILINEVGMRDGLQQLKRPVSLEDKLQLAEALVASGIRAIEATSFVSPKAVPQMADADELFLRLPQQEKVSYSALVPNIRGLQRAIAASVREIAVVLSATETMNQRNINMSLAATRSVCTDTLCAAGERKIRGKAYIAVAFTCPFEGAVSPATVMSLAREMLAAGAEEIVIADTIGAANPAQVKHLIGECCSEFGAQRLSVHFHDTRGFALANVWAAMEAGVRKFDSSLGGLGGCPFAPGAAGNLATEDVVLMAEQCGFSTGIDIQKLRTAIALAEQMLGLQMGGRTSRWLRAADERTGKARSII